eukprot:4024327-Pyramimonas_sp.AAC.1
MTLRWQHTNTYQRERGNKKCAHLGCHSLGRIMNCGVLICLEHDLSATQRLGPHADRPDGQQWWWLG